METVLVLLQHAHKHTQDLKINQKRLDESNMTKQKHMGHIRNDARLHSRVNTHTHTSHTHTHTHWSVLTLARLNFLDDRQLVVDEHRRAEVSLECSGLMEESREQSFSVSITFLAYRLSWFQDFNGVIWK